MDDEALSADLSESERGEQSRLDAVRLDRLGGVDEVLELAQLGRNVVGVPVARDDSRLEDLSERVHHPGLQEVRQ